VSSSLQLLNAQNAEFKLIILIRMYMLPGQILGAVSDIKIATEQEVDEITIYPTLVTSYIPAYKMLKEEE